MSRLKWWQEAIFGVFATSNTLPQQSAANHENQGEGFALGGQNVELVGQIGGLSYAVAVEGNYAYLPILTR